MVLLRGKHAEYICLIALVLIQIFGYNSVDAKIKCVQCGVGNLSACAGKEEPIDCVDDTFTKCYTQINSSGVIQRSCMNATEVDTCKAENNCVVTDEGKNNQLICKKCDGSDEKCSQTDMKINDIKYNQVCDGAVKKCFMKVDNKLVVRGCANDAVVTECTDANTCNVCDTDVCNTGIFPSKRISCYQCSGATCNNVATGDITAKPCLHYEPKEECYTKADNTTSMMRGCKSDTNDNTCSTSDAKGCVFCAEDSCNNADNVFTCIVCRSDLEKKCWNNANKLTGQKCSEEKGCFSGVWSGVAIRGCVSEASAQTQELCKDKNENQCTICHTKDCNTKMSSGTRNGLSFALIMAVFITLCKIK